MRKLMVSLVALAAATLPAHAQTAKPSAGSEQVYWTITFTVPQGDMDKFKPIITQIVAASAKEPGTLEYQYNLAPDGTTIDIVERYTNAQAAVDHVTKNFAPNFSKEFMAIAKPVAGKFEVYGAPNEELKKVLADFKPTYFTTIDGFTK